MTFSTLELDQYEFDFDDCRTGKVNEVSYVGRTLEGHDMYRRLEGHGGYSYHTTEVPPHLFVYDEALSNPLAMFEAMNDLGTGELIWQRVGTSLGYTMPSE